LTTLRAARLLLATPTPLQRQALTLVELIGAGVLDARKAGKNTAVPAAKPKTGRREWWVRNPVTDQPERPATIEDLGL
jgi:hypothetical protein